MRVVDAGAPGALPAAAAAPGASSDWHSVSADDTNIAEHTFQALCNASFPLPGLPDLWDFDGAFSELQAHGAFSIITSDHAGNLTVAAAPTALPVPTATGAAPSASPTGPTSQMPSTGSAPGAGAAGSGSPGGSSGASGSGIPLTPTHTPDGKLTLHGMLTHLLTMQWIVAFIDGLPGVGKTTLAKSLIEALKIAHPGADAVQLIAVRGIVASQAGGRTMAYTFDTMSWERGRKRTATYADAESRSARLEILVVDEYEELSQEKLKVRASGPQTKTQNSCTLCA